jgi:hypothetical protein
MRPLLLTLMLSAGFLPGLATQSGVEGPVGTWRGPAQCMHAGGETLLLTISRDANGTYTGATDWARSGSDGSRGPAVPFSTVEVDGNQIRATATANGRTARLTATLKDETLEGGWAIDGDDDRWTFTATRQR